MQKLSQKFESLIKYLIAAIIVFAGLFMKFPLVFVEGSSVSVRFEDFLILITVIIWIVYVVSEKKIKFVFGNILTRTISLYFLVTALSLFAGIFLTNTVSPLAGIFHWARRFELMILAPIVATSIKKRSDFRFLIKVFVLTSIVVVAYGFGQKYLHFPLVSTINSESSIGKVTYLDEGGRLVSTFAGHYDLAVYLMISIIAGGVYAIKNLNLKRNFLKFATSGTYIIISMVLLVMTAARLTFIAVFVGVIFAIFSLKKFKLLLVPLVLLITFLVFPSQLRDRYVSTIKVNFENSFESFSAVNQEHETRSKLNIPTLGIRGNKIESGEGNAADVVPGEPSDITELGVYRSFAIRLDVEWPRAIRAFVKNPITGTGFSSIGLATDNDYLRSLGEVGILGSYAFFLVIFIVVKKSFKLMKSKNRENKYYSAFYVSVLVALLVNAFFIDVFEASKIGILFWIMTGGIFFLVNNDSKTENN